MKITHNGRTRVGVTLITGTTHGTAQPVQQSKALDVRGGDERQQHERAEGDKHWYDKWSNWNENWVQNGMTDGHKIEHSGQQLDPEQDDGL